MKSPISNQTCQICHKEKRSSELVPAASVRPSVVELIVADHPEWMENGYVCYQDLNRYRSLQVQRVLEAEKGELTKLEHDVIESIREGDLVAENVERELDRRLKIGERVADRVADFGGSWTFLLLFAAALFVWIAVNSIQLFARPFDPYPFILLNLVLSCLAAVQAPVIMMSQNRQETKDRIRAEHDYRVNLKAEVEVRQLHAKLDMLLSHQWQRLLEIQQLQMDLMEEIAGAKNRRQPQLPAD